MIADDDDSDDDDDDDVLKASTLLGLRRGNLTQKQTIEGDDFSKNGN